VVGYVNSSDVGLEILQDAMCQGYARSPARWTRLLAAPITGTADTTTSALSLTASGPRRILHNRVIILLLQEASYTTHLQSSSLATAQDAS
jgi:hypothetical protein